MSDLSLALGIIVSTVVTGGLAYQSGVATVADDGPVYVAASLALVMGSSGYFGPRCIALTRALCLRRKMAGLSDSIETSERLVAEIESFLDRAVFPSNEAPQARQPGQAPPAIPTVIKAAEQASAFLTVLHAAILKLPVPHRAFHAREYEHLRGRLVDQLQRTWILPEHDKGGQLTAAWLDIPRPPPLESPRMEPQVSLWACLSEV
jgi:hypothetical protein